MSIYAWIQDCCQVNYAAMIREEAESKASISLEEQNLQHSVMFMSMKRYVSDPDFCLALIVRWTNWKPEYSSAGKFFTIPSTMAAIRMPMSSMSQLGIPLTIQTQI